MAYVYVEGAAETPPVITEEHQIKQILHWVGFRTNNQKNAIYADSIHEYSDLIGMTESDIVDMAKDYASREARNGRMTFGLRKIKKLKSIVNWSKDFQRIGLTPSVEDMNQTTFIDQLDRANRRAKIRKQ